MARRLHEAGIGYARYDNALVKVDNLEQLIAQVRALDMDAVRAELATMGAGSPAPSERS